jgi:hypothetical protein
MLETLKRLNRGASTYRSGSKTARIGIGLHCASSDLRRSREVSAWRDRPAVDVRQQIPCRW